MQEDYATSTMVRSKNNQLAGYTPEIKQNDEMWLDVLGPGFKGTFCIKDRSGKNISYTSI